MLVGLVFATAALLLSPANSYPLNTTLCEDDFTFTFSDPNSDVARGCAWVGSLEPEEQSNICFSEALKFEQAVPPTKKPTEKPTKKPTGKPTTGKPTEKPTGKPSKKPTGNPTTQRPTQQTSSRRLRSTETSLQKESNLIGDFCPGACGICDCPLIEPAVGGECLKQQVGLDCEYGFVIRGCDETDVTCSAERTYICIDDQTWVIEETLPVSCPVKSLPLPLPLPSYGDPCDPKEFCPPSKPDATSGCRKSQAGLNCEYDYIYLGCHFDDLSCFPASVVSCSENQEWEEAVITVEPCIDPSPDNVQFEACTPCPSVSGNSSCPLEVPEDDAACSDPSLLCSYDFSITGCNAFDITCTPVRSFTCDNGRWEELILPASPDCPPTNKICPQEEPVDDIQCRFNGYDPLLSCSYRFVDTSCNMTSENCMATSFYECTEYDGWINAVVGIPSCEGDAFPPDFGHECDPEDPFLCPVEEPDADSTCTDIGIKCGFDYAAGELQPECLPLKTYTCEASGKWSLEEKNILSGALDAVCDPLGCPLIVPEGDCNIGQYKLSCPYNYRYIGCNFEDGYTCEAIETAFCDDGLKWVISSLDIAECDDEADDSVQGDVCQPCPEVSGPSECPSVAPKYNDDCDQNSLTCFYGFEVGGCVEPTCQPSVSFTCTKITLNGVTRRFWSRTEISYIC